MSVHGKEIRLRRNETKTLFYFLWFCFVVSLVFAEPYVALTEVGPGAEFSQENEPKKSRGDRDREEKRKKLLFRKYFIVLTGDTTPWWFATMLWSHAICSYLATPSRTKACLPECLRGSACLEEYSWDLVHTIVSALSNLSPTPPHMVSRSLHHPCLLSSLSSTVY